VNLKLHNKQEASVELLYRANRNYLQNCEYAGIPTATAFISCAVHPLLCFFFIWHLNLGITGAAHAFSLSSWLQLALNSGFMLQQVAGTRQEFIQLMSVRWVSWQEMVEYLSFSIPGTIDLFALFSFMLGGTFLTGYVSTPTLAAQVSIDSVIDVLWYIQLGMKFGTATLVGQAVGRGSPEDAKMVSLLSAVVSVLVWLVVGSPLLIPSVISPLYTHDGDVAGMIKAVLPWWYVNGIQGAIYFSLRGTMEGLGSQAKLFFVTLISTLVAVLVLLLCLFYFKVGIFSMLVATVMHDVTANICLSTFILRHQWTSFHS
jgi:Na+-driven multidrug efflux pump